MQLLRAQTHTNIHSITDIKRKEPVFALLNREILKSITATLYPEDASI